MDTNVPAVESGKESTVNFEGNPMSRPAVPENSDVALFKQKMAQIDSTLSTVTSATTPTTEREQTESLIDLSQKFKDLLGKDTHPIFEHANGNQADPMIDKKTPLLHKGQLSQSEATDTYSDKSVHVKEEGMTKGKGVEVDRPKVPVDSLKKESTTFQDNPYIAPIGTPLITHSNTVQSSGVVETHAAMISQQIKDQIIDRILVSTNDLAANKIVKVVIAPTVLEGTEVNFQKIGDVLSVQFASRNEGSLNFLQVNQADLQGYLQSGLKQFKDVTVSVKSGGSNAETPEDGRSRNRYDYQSLDDDEQ